MKTLHFKFAALGLVLLAFCIAGWKAAGDRLPGAHSVIDAGDFSSLQAAIDALPAEGGMVQLPPGVFEIDAPLRITQGEVTLAGCGAATHIINQNKQGKPALWLGNPKHPGKRPPGDDRLWRVRLTDFRLTGNPESGHGIEAQYVDEIFLEGLTISHHGGDGVLLNFCYEDPRVCDCLLTYNQGVGLNLIGCHDIVVSASQFEENQDALHCKDGFNLTMTGNNLDDHLGHGVVIENTYGSVVSGNMIEECAGTAIILDRDVYGITVSANVIAHNGAGVDLRDAHGCAVSANTFTILKTNALRIGPDSGRITVTGNNFSNSYIGGEVKRRVDDLAAAGMVLEGTEEVVISGNLFAGLRPHGLGVAGDASKKVLLSGNLFVDAPNQSDLLGKDSLQEDNLE